MTWKVHGGSTRLAHPIFHVSTVYIVTNSDSFYLLRIESLRHSFFSCWELNCYNNSFIESKATLMIHFEMKKKD